MQYAKPKQYWDTWFKKLQSKWLRVFLLLNNNNNKKQKKSRQYHPILDMAYGRLSTPAPTIAVTLWKVEYHHFAVLEDVIGSQSSIAFSSAVFSVLNVGLSVVATIFSLSLSLQFDSWSMIKRGLRKRNGFEIRSRLGPTIFM